MVTRSRLAATRFYAFRLPSVRAIAFGSGAQYDEIAVPKYQKIPSDGVLVE